MSHIKVYFYSSETRFSYNFVIIQRGERRKLLEKNKNKQSQKEFLNC